MNQTKTLEIVGPTPPPYGGVSTHIFRIKEHLKEANITFQLINQYRKTTSNIYNPRWILSLFTSKKKLHIHIFSHYLYPILWLTKKINKNLDIIITIHNERLNNSKHQRILFYFIQNTNYYKIISASKNISDALSQSNISATYLPAYVPPTPPTATQSIINKRYKFHTCFNIWSFYENSIQDYGIDFLTELAARNPDHGFYLFLGNNKTEDRATEWLKSQPSNLFLIVGQDLTAQLPAFDIFLRLNRLDAYGISIQEALDLDVLAIATNVCTRPTGAMLVQAELEDIASNYSRISSMETSQRKELARSRRTTPEFHIDLIKIYQDFVKA